MKTQTNPRRAYTLAEFAEMCAHHRSWAYRMVREGRVKTITGYGKQLVPAHEIERILGAAPQSESNDL